MASEILGTLNVGDVVLFHKKGINLGSLGIKLANFFKNGFGQRGWTHAALYLGDDSVIEAYPTGITLNKLSEKYFQNNYSLLFLRHKNADSEKLKKVVEFCLSEKGEKYDTWGLLYFITFNFIPQQFHFILNFHGFGDRFNDKTRYFCSELVARGYEEAGLYCFERESYKIMPSDFYNPLLFSEVGRVELPKEGNTFIRKAKDIIFFIFYILGALFAMALSTFIVLFVIGIIILMIFGITMLVTQKKPENPVDKKMSN